MTDTNGHDYSDLLKPKYNFVLVLFIQFYEFWKPSELFCLKPSIFREIGFKKKNNNNK